MNIIKPPFIGLCLLACLVTHISGCSQPAETVLEWPEVKPEAKPWSRWWWQGSSVTREGLTAELEAYQKAGLGGLELTPIYGVIGEEVHFIDYLSPRWMEMLEYTLQEAERLGLGIDMATGTGWPFGGPWVGADDACKYMAFKKYELKGGESLSEPVLLVQKPYLRSVPNQVYQLYGILADKGEKVTGSPARPEQKKGQRPLEIGSLVEPVEANENLQALALDQVRFEKEMPLQVLMAYSAKGETLNLTEKVDENGRLSWVAPEGQWALYALFQGWHGKMVERAAPGGEGNVIDHFSAQAIRHYLSRFDEAFSGHDTAPLRAFFNDSYEVDDAYGQADWTPGFFETFRERRGYDLRGHLPALFGDGPEEEQARVLSDYRETISDLILDTFTKEWAAWARKRGAIVRNQAHGSPSSILDLYAASDIPETEGTDIIRIKFASSAAHVTGKKLASSESATWLNEHFLSNMADIKENLDRYLVGGVNHIFYHGTCYSPPEEAWPGRLFYAAIHANPRNSLWPGFTALNQYVARTQSFLQAGLPDNDVLLYFPIYDRFASPGREMLEHFDGSGKEGSDFRALADTLQEKGYGFDYISDRQAEQLGVKNGKLLSGETAYRAILIPECRYMPLSTMKKLVELAQAGATVVVYNSLPGSAPGLGELETRQQDFSALRASIKPDAQGVARVGKGVFLLGGALQELLSSAGVAREQLADYGLEYTRRSYEFGNYYFLANWQDQGFDGWIPIQRPAKAVALFDPMTGKSGFAQTRVSADGRLELRLQLGRGASCILQTYQAPVSGKAWEYIQTSGQPLALDGNWDITFVAGGPEMPPAVKGVKPGSWVVYEGQAYQRFSGTARYSIEFARPEGAGRGWLLDLGQVAECASVKLNGKEAGALLGPTFQLFLDEQLFRANNLLEVEVSNLMANRIADMDTRGVPWKKFYNVNFPARRPENRGPNGLFDASGWAPRPSGLLGPVTLTRVE
ncbi:MAG: hypothetical protein KDC66_02390 [Phaeodactylibacter sp.]|nr:hypothetical protein [Phaeodactylibacter sp.]MCB9274199.1 glycoside hydrolase family 2 protein [Lewinellaceae bacterium]